MTANNETKQLYTLAKACEVLSISTATGRNWVKNGKLIHANHAGTKLLFSPQQLTDLKNKLATESISSLKSRRNKTCISGSRNYSSYIDKASANHASLKQLTEFLENTDFHLTDRNFRCILRDCAEKLLQLSGATCFPALLDNLVSEEHFTDFIESFADLKHITYTYIPSEDTLGFLYLSLSSLQSRKASGSYYTPGWLAKKLVNEHLSYLASNKKILDPSCGSGCFLLHLPDTLPLQNIHGTDLNPVSITLTRINLAMKYRISTKQELATLYQNITAADYLNAECTTGTTAVTHYDIILGNPPWGARLSAWEKKNYRKIFSCAAGSAVETFDLFIEQSLKHLTPGGILSFVLPEALLTVKAHMPVRKLLLQNTHALSVEYLGEVFEQVHCPSIILTLAADPTKPFCQNTRINTKESSFSIRVERTFYADSFPFSVTDEEYTLLQKILSLPGHTTLVDGTDFALGIVTGNNASLIGSTPAPDLEPIIKGSDISKYHINSCSGYISFQPEVFQQTAPEHFYRAPEKLFYRFINKQLTFAYDNTGLLSLNSCNILIPRIEGLHIKYILAILNSSVAQFVFEKKFHSVKVLRSHLEQIPIPVADTQTQEEIVELVEFLMETKETSAEYKKTFTLLDKRIAELFGLSAAEYKLINS